VNLQKEVLMKVSKAVLPVAWAAGALALASAPASATVPNAAAPAVHGISDIQGMAVLLDEFGRPTVNGSDVGTLVPEARKAELKKLLAINWVKCNDNCGPD
jgi:hypothetical protein